MRYKLSAKGTEGYHTAGGDGVVLERGKKYELNAKQIAALGKQVEPADGRPAPKRRKKATR